MMRSSSSTIGRGLKAAGILELETAVLAEVAEIASEELAKVTLHYGVQGA